MIRQELNYLRAFLCIFIVVTHVLTRYTVFLEPDENQLDLLYWIRNIFITATPAFIILSALLSTLNYKEALPKRYLLDRIKYIVLPYIFVGSFYCYVIYLESSETFWSLFDTNVLRGFWHGYFVIVIFQFYILSIVIYKLSPKLNYSKTMLVISFIINFIYLYTYYEVEVVTNFFDSYYPLSPQTNLLGWIFFYFFGSYIGKNYDAIKSFVNKETAIIIMGTIIAYSLFYHFADNDHKYVTSFHYSLMFLHTMMFLLLLNISISMVGFLSRNIYMISQYSLFIFLFHPIVLPYIYDLTEPFEFSTVIFISLTLLFTLGTCIGTGMLLSSIKLFRFVIGKQPYKT